MQSFQRGCHSPTETMHTIGGLSNKIISTNLLINKCTICSNYDAQDKSIKEKRQNCICKINPSYKCIHACKAKMKINDTEARIKNFESICTKTYCPPDKSCVCKSIGPTKAKITRDVKKLKSEKDIDNLKKIQERIDGNKVVLDRLLKQCVKTLHGNTCKCRVLPHLREEIKELQQFRDGHIKNCSSNYNKIILFECTPTSICSECIKNKRYEEEIRYEKCKNKFDHHDCLKN